MIRTVLGFFLANNDIPIIAKRNARIPEYRNSNICYYGTSKLMGHYATLARDCGATIIGGCCGTTPKHLQAMREASDNHTPGIQPKLKAITKALGEFSSENDGTDGNISTRKRQNRRNRIE
jgi:5-methyltetrahydrofolate--homocysteine methyltransferase